MFGHVKPQSLVRRMQFLFIVFIVHPLISTSLSAAPGAIGGLSSFMELRILCLGGILNIFYDPQLVKCCFIRNNDYGPDLCLQNCI